MTDAASASEQEQFEWYTAYRFGVVIGEGPTPMPDDIQEQATEIRWSMGVEEVAPVVPYDDSAIRQSLEEAPTDPTTDPTAMP